MSGDDALTPPLALPEQDALELLACGDIVIEGRVVGSSNATFYCAVSHNGVQAACVYKPVRGERPLWDFPDGTLAEREAAAYAVSAATGWDLIPPTVLRDGPLGAGMVQLWVEADSSVDLGELIYRRDEPALERIAVLDAVINNADRKGGHLLPTQGGRIYGIDHGLTFNEAEKLRTVLWQWAGDPLDEGAVDVLAELLAAISGSLGEALSELLSGREIRRTQRRIQRLLNGATHPNPPRDRRAMPWPPF
ncbi:MAG: SCO1664 family protein [Frankiaceae bacterium]|nr:SCO1664 family protein [Frankiaceae bacterium]